VEKVNPDLDWYSRESRRRDLPTPRCPFASVRRCPRYWESLSLLGEAGSTKIDPEEDRKLKERWSASDIAPATEEQSPSISGPDGRISSFSNFCPEVLFDRFGLFVSYLAEYVDELDREAAHRRLRGEGAPGSDPRWTWWHFTPMHYADCPVYSLLADGGERPHDGAPNSEHGSRRRIETTAPHYHLALSPSLGRNVTSRGRSRPVFGMPGTTFSSTSSRR
jgi:hypothetical protein